MLALINILLVAENYIYIYIYIRIVLFLGPDRLPCAMFLFNHNPQPQKNTTINLKYAILWSN